jgi:microcystin-dependent protein
MPAETKWRVRHQGKEIGEFTEAEIRVKRIHGQIPPDATVSREDVEETSIGLAFPVHLNEEILDKRIERCVDECTRKEAAAFRGHIEGYLRYVQWFVGIVATLAAILSGLSLVHANKRLDLARSDARTAISETKDHAKDRIDGVVSTIRLDMNKQFKKYKDALVSEAEDEIRSKVGGLTEEMTSAVSNAADDARKTAVDEVQGLAMDAGVNMLREKFDEVLRLDPERLGKWVKEAVLSAGSILPWPGPISDKEGKPPPDGWLLCNGASLPQEGEYANLHRAIGTAWGPADPEKARTHFNLPDLRGMFLRGAGANGNPQFQYAGDATREVGKPQQHQYQAHTHQRTPKVPESDPREEHKHAPSTSPDCKDKHGTEAAATVSSGFCDDETRPNNYAVHWIIKY